MLRKIAVTVVLVPLAVVIIAFAVANRHSVTVSLDPFDPAQPAGAVTLPLFALIIAVLILGVVVGGSAAWLRHGKWRRVARRLEREAAALRSEVERHRRTSSAPPTVPEAIDPPQRLRLTPPVR
jgi:uncharacterized integral membrane protein